jgi:hypothetical protein
LRPVSMIFVIKRALACSICFILRRTTLEKISFIWTSYKKRPFDLDFRAWVDFQSIRISHLLSTFTSSFIINKRANMLSVPRLLLWFSHTFVTLWRRKFNKIKKKSSLMRKFISLLSAQLVSLGNRVSMTKILRK